MNKTPMVFTQDPKKEVQFTFTNGEHWVKWKLDSITASFDIQVETKKLDILTKTIASELIDPEDDSSTSLTFSLMDPTTNVEQSMKITSFDTDTGKSVLVSPTNIPKDMYYELSIFFSRIAYYVFGEGRGSILKGTATREQQLTEPVLQEETNIQESSVETDEKPVKAPTTPATEAVSKPDPFANRFTNCKAVQDLNAFYDNMKKK